MSTNMVTRTKRTKKGFNIIDAIADLASSHKGAKSDEFYDILETAKREWKDAQTYFNSVSDSELIDYAIHMMEAAEAKYMYLLNQAKNENYTVDLSRII